MKTDSSINIVGTDTYLVDFDGLSWAPVASLGEFVGHPFTPAEQIVDRLQEADVAVVNKTPLTREIFSSLPRLRFVAVTATGVNNVGLAGAAARDVQVANVPGYSSESVAQYVFSCILDFATRLSKHRTPAVHEEWRRGDLFSLPQGTLHEIAGQTLGVVGLGAIGGRVAEIASAFRMNVLVAALPGRSYREPRPSLDDVCRAADYLTIHCPLTEQTRNLISERELSLMKSSAVVINTARGGIVSETALAETLEQQRIAAAYLDVLSEEPPKNGSPLFSVRGASVTPHVAWATREARERLIHETATNIEAFLSGVGRNRVA